MYILEEIKADKAGRISIKKLFDEMPKRVLILYSMKEKAIFFRDDPKSDWLVAQRKVDSKNRVVLPKWVRQEFGDEYYITAESKERHCLLIKKFIN